MTEGEPTTIWETLAATGLAVFLRENAWAYPLLETLHMVGLALLVGGILIFDLRVLGVGRELSVRSLANLVLPLVWTGFAVNVVSGGLLFVSDAAEFASNSSLKVKLALIALAGINALAFHRGVLGGVAAWDRDTCAPTTARTLAAVSLLLWLGVVTAGRMMAYLK